MSLPINIVVPTSAGKLAHPVGAASASPGGRFLVAASSDSTRISVFSAASPEPQMLDVKRQFDCLTLAIDAHGEQLAFVERGSRRLCVFDLVSAQPAFVEHESPPVACSFDARGRLWTVRLRPEGFVMEIRAPGTAEVLAAAAFSDGYHAAGGAFLRSGTWQESVLVETYSGQSEQAFHVCTLVSENCLSIEHVPILDGNQQVFVSSDGSCAISLDHGDPAVVRYSSGFELEQSRIPWPDYDEGESEDESPGYASSFLDAVHALVSSSEGRLFLLGVEEMEFVSELHVEGHAPVAPLGQVPEAHGSWSRVGSRCVRTLWGFGSGILCEEPRPRAGLCSAAHRRDLGPLNSVSESHSQDPAGRRSSTMSSCSMLSRVWPRSRTRR